MTRAGPQYPEKVQREIDAGRLWRAREMLAGRIPQQPFSPEFYEQYGSVLLRLGEMMHAGMYLFLSGASDPAYEEAIGVYLHRLRKHGWQGLMQSWPQRAWRMPVAELPEPVRRELIDLGMPDGYESEAAASDAASRKSGSGSHASFNLGCLLLVVVILISLAVGLTQIARWIFG